MSFRLRCVNLSLKWLARPLLRRATDPGRLRAMFQLTSRLFLARPWGVSVRRDAPQGACPALTWVAPPGPSGKLILYFHGGGYIAGSAADYRGLLAHLARATGALVCAPDYRLAPEHPLPAAWDDARAAWEAVIAAGHRPEEIVLGGDSAGGGLALSLLAQLCAAGTPPGAAFAFSPLTDMTGTAPSLGRNAASDLVLPLERFDELAAMVLQGHDPSDPRASPLFASYPGCPPVFLAVSDSEGLYDDSDRLVTRLRAEGAPASLHVGHACPHAWPILAGRLPEADRTIAAVADFLKGVFAR